MSAYVLDDEPDVETLFGQQFRRDLKSERFKMEFALSAYAQNWVAISQIFQNRLRQNADLSRRFKLIWAVQSF